MRSVTLRATWHDMTGDEAVEVWLKRGDDPWELATVDAVDLTEATQLFTITGLESDVLHVVQLRASREGRYLAGYLDGDPDEWPEQSRFEFTPGTSSAGPPTINSAIWARTSSVAQQITVNITAAVGSEALDIELYRDGVLLDTIPGPNAAPFDYVDHDPDLAEFHEYKCRHIDGDLHGDFSNIVNVFAGPIGPVDFMQTGVIPQFYAYEVGWTMGVAGAVTRIRDDWNLGLVQNRALTGVDVTDQAVGGLEKDSAHDPNGNVLTHTQVEARHELAHFTVIDVSEWVAISAAIDEADDETAH